MEMLKMFDELKQVRKALAIFQEAKELFEMLASAPVFVEDGSKLPAIKVAQGLIKTATEHQGAIEDAIRELVDPKTAKSEFERLLKNAQDNESILNDFLENIQSLVGVQFELIRDVLEKRDAEAKK